MNSIAVHAKMQQDREGGPNYLCVDVLIDDVLLVNEEQDGCAVDLVALAKTVASDGSFFIVTCACGIAGCAGIDEGIKVRRDSRCVSWTVRNIGRGKQPARSLQFDAEAYETAVRRAIRDFMQLRHKYPNLDTVPRFLKDNIENLPKGAHRVSG